MSSGFKSTTLRDFTGGWNALDDDLNLSGSYQPVLDNIHRGLDNLLSVRYGYELFADMLDGVETTGTTSIQIDTTSASREVLITWTAHPFSNHEHITFTESFTVGGLVTAELYNKPHGVYVVDANSFKIWLRTAATSTASSTASRAWKRDTHMLAGVIIENTYFDDTVVVVDDRGEIAKIDRVGTKTRIFDVSISIQLLDNPIGWVECTFVSSDVFKGQLLVANGLDKPLQIDYSVVDEVQFLVDLGTGSNANTPVCRYVKAVGRWVTFAGDAEFPNRVHISSTDTSGTFFGDAAPNDATYIDINYASNSPSFIIRGINKFREFVVAGFDDNIVLLQLGTYDTATPPNHVPSISDVIARHGVVAHKSMAFLGFDLLMLDPVGVPSLAKSLYDGSVVPSRQSAVITPPLQRNIGRLSPDTLQDKVFAVYNTHAFQYMLFIPDFDDDIVTLPTAAFFVPAAFVGTGKVLVHLPNHDLEEGNHIEIAGAVDFAGIVASYLNTEHTIAGVIDEDYFMIEVDTVSTFIAQGTTDGTTLKRVFHDTIGYVYTYNKSVKAKSWARYRDMRFNAGCTSVYGRVFLSTDHRVWRLGNQFEQVFADKYNDYDVIWTENTLFTVGIKAYDPLTNETYTCMTEHTSSSGEGDTLFLTDRETHADYWAIYEGEDISFVVETPWADFNERTKLKLLEYFGMDARGKGRINVSLFVDYYYRNRVDGQLLPQLSMDMVGGDTGGFGYGEQSVGSGRVATRQRLWKFPARGKLLKIRLAGATKRKLKIVSMQFEYKLGGISR